VIAASFLRIFFLVSVALAGCFLAFTLIVDPYGVSPLHLSIEHFNRYRPARVDIDRLIKPYEVWRYQPKTIFMGTSRIQQGFNPGVLAGTRFAPAYNAAVPADSVQLNAAYLRQYLELDPGIKTVVMEVFFYQFLHSRSSAFIEQGSVVRKTFGDFLDDAASLFLSVDTLEAALKTVVYNFTVDAPVYEIKPGGYFFYPPGHKSKGLFDSFPIGIWRLDATRPVFRFDEQSFRAFHDIVATCRRHGVSLIVVLTPNHAYDDYYLDLKGAWPMYEDWLLRLTRETDILSFSQPNAWTYEPVATYMPYWNDPYHFTIEMGTAIQRALADEKTGAPANFELRLTPDNVHAYRVERERAIQRWMTNHGRFMAQVAEERRKADGGL
jgi:hypothetical protein